MLVRLESANTGKPLEVSRDDIASTVDTFRFFAGAARAITSQAAADYTENHLSIIIREPLGVVGVVTPWNYPLLMAAWKIAPILAAGNALVIKPSEQTPLTTMKFAELVADLLPAGVLNVVTGTGPVVGARLAEHPDLDMIALTGSVQSGRAVAQGAALTLKRVHLELVARPRLSSSRTPTWRRRQRAFGQPGIGIPARSAAQDAEFWSTSLSPTRSSSTWSTRWPPSWWASRAPEIEWRSVQWCRKATSIGSSAI